MNDLSTASNLSATFSDADVRFREGDLVYSAVRVRLIYADSAMLKCAHNRVISLDLSKCHCIPTNMSIRAARLTDQRKTFPVTYQNMANITSSG
ncbi:hypothetical protein RRG08_053665 [Elysia crispata]|uniref:Uncharacterized protein n=1 Tax=Elysia crispata TaxID=231223 RepID=A0AAE1DKM2_9GAST|nr:hypothetical protein RRG08_053665 [Elysia crispata]